MAVYENRRLLITDEELPRVNGVSINAIYAQMETAYRTDQIMRDANEKQVPDYYLLVTDDKDFKDGKWKDVPDLKVRTLPPSLANLFGKHIINGETKFVTNLWIRTRCSGNGSFIDQSISFSSFSYYRTKRFTNSNESNVFIGEPFEENIKAVLGKKFKAEVMPPEFDVEFPVCYIRREGGLNYPDTKLSGWRRYGNLPYVSNNGYNTDNIRVYYEPWNAHLFFQVVKEPEVGDEELVKIHFPRLQSESPDQFCHIARWNDTKKEDPDGIIRWTINKVDKKDNWSYHVTSVLNGRVQFKQQCHNDFYRLVSIVKI